MRLLADLTRHTPRNFELKRAHNSRSSIFLPRIVGLMFMRVNSRCAHHSMQIGAIVAEGGPGWVDADVWQSDHRELMRDVRSASVNDDAVV